MPAEEFAYFKETIAHLEKGIADCNQIQNSTCDKYQEFYLEEVWLWDEESRVVVYRSDSSIWNYLAEVRDAIRELEYDYFFFVINNFT